MDRVCRVIGLLALVAFVLGLVAIYPVSQGAANLRFDHPPVTVVPPMSTAVWWVYLPVVMKANREVYLPVVMKAWR